jgi:limonene-1,2-epoxide hydrolase
MAEVIKSHTPDTGDVLRARTGEVLTCERRPTPWDGWLWCRDAGGDTGWAPESWLAVEGPSYTLQRDYDATEVSVGPGEKFDVYETYGGWAFGRSSRGFLGWIPEECLAPSPTMVVQAWVHAFNAADAQALADLYHEDAVNHQVAEARVAGRGAIRRAFEEEFATAEMTCIVEHLFEDGAWAILEWRDPLGLRGCGFFHVVDGKIRFQRGYWDKLSFLRQHGLPLPTE